jgi:putative GTP pyrophosphokinase
MAWVVPKFTKSEVDRAGVKLAKNAAEKNDYKIINNWRSSHSYPLNFFQNDLRRRAKAQDVATISGKNQRFEKCLP